MSERKLCACLGILRGRGLANVYKVFLIVFFGSKGSGICGIVCSENFVILIFLSIAPVHLISANGPINAIVFFCTVFFGLVASCVIHFLCNPYFLMYSCIL